MTTRAEMEAYYAGKADGTTKERITAELNDSGSFACQYVREMCEEARTLYENLDWRKLLVDE